MLRVDADENKQVLSLHIQFAPKNTSVRDGFEVDGQLIPDACPATEKARSPSLSLVDCLTGSLLLAELFEARPDTDAVIVRRFCR